MSGLRERVEALRDEWADPLGRGPVLTKRDCAAELSRILDADPATADAPADTGTIPLSWFSVADQVTPLANPEEGPKPLSRKSSLAPQPLAPGVDAPADTTLRDQIARTLHEAKENQQNHPHCFDDDSKTGGVHKEFCREEYRRDADALLPLLRAHDAQVEPPARTAARNRLIEKRRDAQVAAQARRDALNEVLDRADEGIEFGPSNYLLLRRIVAHVRRGRAEQDTPDQANT